MSHIRQPSMLRLAYWGGLVSLSALIFILSSQPVHLPLPPFPMQDKLLHASVYGVLAILAQGAFGRHWAWALLYAVAFGASDEWHQSFVPGRVADLWDWCADGVGASLALWLRHYKGST